MNKFDQFCNKIIEEQYSVTGREVLYRRYGKDVADKMIAKIKARGNDSYLNNKYALPDYSQQNLDKIIPVIFSSSAAGAAKKYGGNGEVQAYNVKTFNPVGNSLDRDEIVINKNASGWKQPWKELQGKNFNISNDEDVPEDILGHETTHALQKGKTYTSNPLQAEIAPMLGEIKRWYYYKTGILLDADATDKQINQFIFYCRIRNIFNKVAYGNKIDFEKLLKSSEGQEVFRRIVKKTPIINNTMVA
jgi:hypothetical protein